MNKQDAYWHGLDLWYEYLKNIYETEKKRNVIIRRRNMREWTDELREDPHVKRVFKDKVQEFEDKIHKQKRDIDKLYRKYFDRMDEPVVEGLIKRQKKQLKDYKKKWRRWRYLYNKVSGKKANDSVDVEVLKEQVRIEPILNVEQKNYGKTMINCPVHNENTPSCCIYHETNSFYCFGCGAGGSVIDAVMKTEKMSFKDAVNLLTGQC